MVSDDTLEGLGTIGFIFQALFGTLVKLASQPPIPLRPPKPPHPETHPPETPSIASDQAQARPMQSETDGYDDHEPAVMQFEEGHDLDQHEQSQADAETAKSRLTEYLPHPGYFLAGAVSGGVSRTATAPFDRLKVYLLVNTQTSTNVAIDAVKRGRIITALRNSYRPIGDAVVTLWKAGGFRTFFAGKSTAFTNNLKRSGLTGGRRKWVERGQNHARIGDPSKLPPASK